jgi:hypothetical protein
MSQIYGLLKADYLILRANYGEKIVKKEKEFDNFKEQSLSNS